MAAAGSRVVQIAVVVSEGLYQKRDALKQRFPLPHGRGVDFSTGPPLGTFNRLPWFRPLYVNNRSRWFFVFHTWAHCAIQPFSPSDRLLDSFLLSSFRQGSSPGHSSPLYDDSLPFPALARAGLVGHPASSRSSTHSEWFPLLAKAIAHSDFSACSPKTEHIEVEAGLVREHGGGHGSSQ